MRLPGQPGTIARRVDRQRDVGDGDRRRAERRERQEADDQALGCRPRSPPRRAPLLASWVQVAEYRENEKIAVHHDADTPGSGK